MAEVQKKKKERERQNTCMYTLSLGCGTSRSGNDHQIGPSESTALIWLCFYCQCNATILDLRFQLNANRLLTICIRRTIDQSIGLINMIYYSTQRYRKSENIRQLNEHANTANTFTANRSSMIWETPKGEQK